MFSCEFYEITKNTFFIEHLWWLLLDFQQGSEWTSAETVSKGKVFSTATWSYNTISPQLQEEINRILIKKNLSNRKLQTLTIYTFSLHYLYVNSYKFNTLTIAMIGTLC